MKRPALYVRQSEAGPNADNVGDYWWIVKSANGEIILTSKMYRTRARAIRAARHFIKSIRPAPVDFSYWSGTTPTQYAEARALGHTPRGTLQFHTEQIR